MGLGFWHKEDRTGWRGDTPCEAPVPCEDHLHGVDCDSERRVVPIHLGLLGSLCLLGEVLVGDPDPVHTHGHHEH